MSTVISKNVQIGADATPSNNFTWYQPSTPDGTVRLGSGNSGSVTDILSVTSTGLGIGTSSPSFPLDVAGVARSNSWIARTNTSAPTADAFIYRPADNSLGFGTANTERMRIDSSGNVGIGTSSPTSAANTTTLEVANATTARVIVNSTGGRKWGAYTTSSDGRFGIYDYTASADRLILDSSGNLGLGVTPSAWADNFKALDINGGSGGGAVFSASNVPFAGVMTNAYFSSGGAVYKKDGFAGYYLQDMQTGSGGTHKWYTAPSGTAGNAISFTQAMTLNASGNLLVGTTAGDKKITVEGNGISIAPSNASAVAVEMANGYAARQGVTFLNNGSTGYTSFGIISENTALAFKTASYNVGLNTDLSTGWTERARIDSSGRLGINTTSPAALLDIRNTYGNGGGIVRLGTTGDGIVIDGALGSVDFFNSDSDANKVAAQVAGKSGDLYGGGGYLTFSSSVFGGSLTERARIDSSGNLLVGTTSNAAGTKAAFKAASGYFAISVLGETSGQGGGMYYRDGASGSNLFSTQADTNYYYLFDGDGSHYAYFPQNGTAWSFSSDRRIKRDIVDIDYGLNAVMAIQPRRFTYNSSGKNDIGFIAQELREVVPEAVVGEEKAFVDGETNIERASKTLGVSKDTLIPVLVKAIQEQQAIIESLKARLDAANL